MAHCDPFIARVRRTLVGQALLRRGERVLVAVSGGADSTALLAALRALAPTWAWRLTVAHLDHGLRGAASAADARAVAALARRWHLPCVIGRRAVRRLARRQGLSLEMAGRAARYAFFETVARARGCTAIATGHTADDQVETLLLNLARGTGPAGLRGIPFQIRRGACRVVRPLRDVTRAEIVRFLERQALAWREDATNRAPDALRNRVRHELLPLLEQRLNPQIRRALLRLGEVAGAEHAWLEQLTQSLYETCRRPVAGRIFRWTPILPPNAAQAERRSLSVSGNRLPPALDLRRLRDQPQAARRRVLQRWLADAGLPPADIAFDTLARLDAWMLRARTAHPFPLTGGRAVSRQGDCLTLESLNKGPLSWRAVRVKIPGVTRLPALGLWIVTELKPGIVREHTLPAPSFPAQASLNAAAWRRRRIVARPWRPGDRLAPFGLRGTKKLQDIFTDLKWPAEQRRHLPVFACGGELVWVPGYRIARAWAVPDPRARALQVRVERAAIIGK